MEKFIMSDLLLEEDFVKKKMSGAPWRKEGQDTGCMKRFCPKRKAHSSVSMPFLPIFMTHCAFSLNPSKHYSIVMRN